MDFLLTKCCNTTVMLQITRLNPTLPENWLQFQRDCDSASSRPYARSLAKRNPFIRELDNPFLS